VMRWNCRESMSSTVKTILITWEDWASTLRPHLGPCQSATRSLL
jgi:hypothetical protein